MSSPFSPRSGTETGPSRRALIGGALLLTLAPARAEPEDMERAILAFTGGKAPETGKVTLDVAPLVENGNAVSLEIRVDHPVSGENRVTELALFNEKNPETDIALFRLAPGMGRAQVATRIRLATSQHLVAVARLADGTCWADRREVIVTIAACTEE